MAWKKARAAAAPLIADLPAIPRPWNVEELCAQLSAQRGRPLLLHAMNIPALPFGLWYDDGARDHIIYRAGITGYHRDHVVLHEICHLLARHNTADQQASAEGGEGSAVMALERAINNRYATTQEELAEMFASMVLRAAKQIQRTPVSDFERRAAAMFGAA